MVRLLIAAMTITLLAAPSAPAQTDLGDNAALRYWQAIGHWWNWREFTHVDPRDQLTDAEFEPWVEALRHIENDEVAAFLLRAAEFEHCDFGTDPAFSTAPSYLPHLYALSTAHTLMLARARRSADADAGDDMVRHLAAAIRMAEHCSQNAIPVMTSASISMLDRTHELTEFLTERGDLSQPMRARLAAELERFPADDPFRLRASIVNDTEGWVEPMTRLVQSAEGRARLIAYFTDLDIATVLPDGEVETLDTSEQEQQLIRELMTVSPAIIAASLRKAGNARLAAWDAPDREAAMDEFAMALARGDYGELANMAVSPLLTLVYKQERAEATLAAFKDLLAE